MGGGMLILVMVYLLLSFAKEEQRRYTLISFSAFCITGESKPAILLKKLS